MDKEFIDEVAQALGKILKERRIGLGLSTRELGVLIGESHIIAHRVEVNQRKLSIGEFILYCRALGLDPYETLRKVIEEVAKN